MTVELRESTFEITLFRAEMRDLLAGGSISLRWSFSIELKIRTRRYGEQRVGTRLDVAHSSTWRTPRRSVVPNPDRKKLGLKVSNLFHSCTQLLMLSFTFLHLSSGILGCEMARPRALKIAGTARGKGSLGTNT